MRKTLVIGLLMLAFTAQAQIEQVWVSMPDSLCPYLNVQQRKFMLDYALRGSLDTIPNQLQGRSCIEQLDRTHNILRVRLTSALTAELQAGTDTITLIETVCAPLCSTLTRHYNYAWMLLGESRSAWDAEQTEEEKKQLF